MRDEDGERAHGYTGPLDLPDEHGPPEEEESAADPSLADDLSALIADGRTYAESELAFQKSRAAYTADRAKRATVHALFAFGFIHLALVAITVGVLFALIPAVGAWGATGIVTASLLTGAALLLRLAKRRLDEIVSAFGKDGE
ncbi:MAG: phage holin family protein [Erythrobacter sp.]|jgi:hypothetical protein